MSRPPSGDCWTTHGKPPMSDDSDAETDQLVDLLVRAYLEGKDVENPSEGRRRAARSVAEQLAAEYDDAA